MYIGKIEDTRRLYSDTFPRFKLTILTSVDSENIFTVYHWLIDVDDSSLVTPTL